MDMNYGVRFFQPISTHLKKADSLARYSLIISLHTEAQEVDIYTPVKVAIDSQIQTPVATPV